MKKLSLAAICAVVLIFVIGLSVPVKAQPVIDVAPEVHDFGDVEVGTPSTTIITASNVGVDFLVVDAIFLSGGSGPDFYISMIPDLPAIINPPDGGVINSIEVEVTFLPSAAGAFSTSLVIVSNDQTVTVSLGGVGVAAEPPPPHSIADILAFFDASVADGTLVGNGPGNSADGRRKALRNIIAAAGDLIENGQIAEACQQLLNAYQRCDGLPRPPEFVTGPAAPTLAEMILDLMGELGCD